MARLFGLSPSVRLSVRPRYNDVSSRSHALLQLTIDADGLSDDADGDGTMQVYGVHSKLMLVS